MSLANLTVKARYSGDDVTTTFGIPHDIIEDDSAEVQVCLRDEADANAIIESVLTEGVDYTLTGATPPSMPFNTDVEMTTAPASTEILLVRRAMDKVQSFDADENSIFLVETVERKLDRLTALVQNICEEMDRSPRLPKTTGLLRASSDLAEPVACGVWTWNKDKDAIEYKTADELLAEAVGGFQGFKGPFVLADSQAAPADIPELLLDSAKGTSFWIFMEITRAGETIFNNTQWFAKFRSGVWEISESLGNGDLHGVTITIEAGGQVQYISDGTGVGTFKYRILGMGNLCV